MSTGERCAPPAAPGSVSRAPRTGAARAIVIGTRPPRRSPFRER